MEELISFFLNDSGTLDSMTVFSIILISSLGLLPAPLDLFLIALGVLSQHGYISSVQSIFVAIVAVATGETIIFFLANSGKKLGKRLFSEAMTKKPILLAKIQSITNRKGVWGPLFIRLNPFFRPYIILGCLVLGMRNEVFLRFNYLMITIQTICLITFPQMIMNLFLS